MITFKKFAIAAALCAAGIGAQPALAQSTDGYFTTGVFPIVVDSSTFTQRFTFRNPNAQVMSIAPYYTPGLGTTQATNIACPTINLPANGQMVFTSLRAICPTLAAGSGQFGALRLYESSIGNHPFAGFSRVTNFAGNGFSVEMFPAHTFTSATAVVTGLRRMAASGSSPAFQTNCFAANLADITPANPQVSTPVDLTLYTSAGAVIGSMTPIALVPGQLYRMLDVFNAVGAPAGDYVDARAEFFENGAGEPALMTFCTVQDNTSFGADFRIGKQEQGNSQFSPYFGVGGQDDHTSRNSTMTQDISASDGVGTATTRLFSLPSACPGCGNTHVMYFRHPDWIHCEIIDPNTGVRALAAYGLEMRMMDSNGTTVIAGGDEIYGFSDVYLGDKVDRNGGLNGRYTIEVENGAAYTAVVHPYSLHCQSGSGHSGGDMIRYNETGISRF